MCAGANTRPIRTLRDELCALFLSSSNCGDGANPNRARLPGFSPVMPAADLFSFRHPWLAVCKVAATFLDHPKRRRRRGVRTARRDTHVLTVCRPTSSNDETCQLGGDSTILRCLTANGCGLLPLSHRGGTKSSPMVIARAAASSARPPFPLSLPPRLSSSIQLKLSAVPIFHL